MSLGKGKADLDLTLTQRGPSVDPIHGTSKNREQGHRGFVRRRSLCSFITCTE